MCGNMCGEALWRVLSRSKTQVSLVGIIAGPI